MTMSESAKESGHTFHDVEISSVMSDKDKLIITRKTTLLGTLTSKALIFIVVFIAVNVVIWTLLVHYDFSLTDDDDDDSSSTVSTFEVIFPKNYIVTGIRQDIDNKVIITGGTGFLNSSAWIYNGPLSDFPTTPDDSSIYHHFWPNFPNQTVNATTLYSCNTHYFDTRIPPNNFTGVGSYNYEQSAITQSFIYKGDMYGTGEFTQIKIPPQWFVNETTGLNTTREVGHTVAHSVMGDIIVGNWLYANEYDRGHVFIMNMATGKVTTVDEGLYFGLSVTLYGVWQNGGQNSTKYTLAGGIYTGEYQNQEHAFLQNYDPFTEELGPMSKYVYNNDSSYATHFEGVSGVEGGFSMAASQIKHGISTASYCFVPYNETDGTYGDATWIMVNNTVDQTPINSGNTVIDYSVLGVFNMLNDNGMFSFIADVSSIFF